MRFSIIALLVAATAGSLVSAGIDICHGPCKMDDPCSEDKENGAHCCGVDEHGKDIVLHCDNGAWKLRNPCGWHNICTCTMERDLVCMNIHEYIDKCDLRHAFDH
ncbi:hypothetical protein PG997_013699 [Apiospora hydei]|uniref:Uncharacterized protein n=1 Tax=Apiospora hydei TaxID=1337664 RepID=A0ABR1V7N9_9PEZI